MSLSPLLDPILEWAVEFIFKKILKDISKIPEKIREGYPARFALVVQKGGLIEQEKETRAIQAVQEEREIQVLYRCGGEGLVKTRPLEETDEITYQLSLGQTVQWAGIIDLYHNYLCNSSHVQNEIIAMLDLGVEFFGEFYNICWRFEKTCVNVLAFLKSYNFAQMCNPKLSKTIENEMLLHSALKWVKRYSIGVQHEKATEWLMHFVSPAYTAWNIGKNRL